MKGYDTNDLVCASMVSAIIFGALGIMYGYSSGEWHIKRQAIIRGAAEYGTKNGRPQFQWKKDEASQ